MNPLLALTLLFVLALSPALGSLWELNKMIQKATGRSPLLYYSFYGCYCGLGGRGQPQDATDRCCQTHDGCYSRLLSSGCNAKVRRYRFDGHPHSPSCRRGSWCSQLSCECDRSLALCLRATRASYSKAFLFHPKSRCG